MNGSNQRKTGGAYRRTEQLISLYAKSGKDRSRARQPKNRKRKCEK